MPELTYLLALHSLNKLGALSLVRLLSAFQDSAEAAWQEPQQWRQAAGLSAAAAAEVLAARQACSPERLHEAFLASGASLLTLWDEPYPALLRQIYAPPPLLFYYGELPTEDDICLAMIGSRRASAYGYQVAELLAHDLAAQGLWIVSGMARGIDGICHEYALKAGGKTLAVLGSGVDVVYPREHRDLYQRIIENGAVVSEFPLGSTPLPGNFPQRNRIISGFSRGVLVIEADEKSGTLLTVDHGLEQGRDIFAVPGPIISPVSRGTNRLLKQGAKIVLCAEDVWREYLDEPRPVVKKQQQAPQQGPVGEEQALLSKMVMPVHFDELLAQSGLPAQKLAALLTMWEIRGLIRQLPGKYYQAKAHKL